VVAQYKTTNQTLKGVSLMTDISVYTQQFPTENLSWDLSNLEVPYVEGGTIDVSKFTQAQHFPNGFIPSGTVLGKVTASGLLAPYLGSASDGTQAAVGILRASVSVVQLNGTLKSKVGVAVLKAFGVVSVSKLPFTSSNAAAGGYIDAAGQTALSHIHFAA
jgi:hypothetical protein